MKVQGSALLRFEREYPNNLLLSSSEMKPKFAFLYISYMFLECFLFNCFTI